MNFETTRVYREIIEEVTRNLDLPTEMCIKLKHDWSHKLREMTQPQERNLDFKAIHEENSSDYDSDERLEKIHPNYMMCLYVKVDKSKHKWKVKLKQGFLNIGKIEFVFDMGHGDLHWC